MADDKMSLAACLCSTTANCAPSDLKWKPMTGTTSGCAANQVMATMTNGQATCISGYGGMYSKTIAGIAGDTQTVYSPATFMGCFFKNPLTGDCTCPAGFSPHVIGGFDDRSECKYYNPPGGCGIMTYGCF